jgi:hypothetical protein
MRGSLETAPSRNSKNCRNPGRCYAPFTHFSVLLARRLQSTPANTKSRCYAAVMHSVLRRLDGPNRRHQYIATLRIASLASIITSTTWTVRGKHAVKECTWLFPRGATGTRGEQPDL